MAAKRVTIDIDLSTGRISLVDGALFVGEQATLVFTGYTPDTGHMLALTLFAHDNVTPIADNHTSSSVLDLRGQALREAFKDNQAADAFYTVLTEKDENGVTLPTVNAVGQMYVQWSPATFTTVSGAVATLKGDKGDKGDKGERGEAGYVTRIADSDGKWHNVMAVENSLGELVVGVEQEEAEGAANRVVDTDLAQTITGVKTFSNGLVGNVTGNASTATILATTRTITVQDNDGTNIQASGSFNGSSNMTMTLPATIKATVTGNATTATTLATARTITVQDNDGTHTQASGSFDGSANIAVTLPATIKASITGDTSGNVTIPDNAELTYKGTAMPAVLRATGMVKGADELAITATATEYTITGDFTSGMNYKVCVLWTASNVAGKLKVNGTEETAVALAGQPKMAIRTVACVEDGSIPLTVSTSSASYIKSVVVLAF